MELDFWKIKEFLKSGQKGNILFYHTDGTYHIGWESGSNWGINPKSDIIAWYQIKEKYNKEEDDLEEWAQQVYEKMNNHLNKVL